MGLWLAARWWTSSGLIHYLHMLHHYDHELKRLPERLRIIDGTKESQCHNHFLLHFLFETYVPSYIARFPHAFFPTLSLHKAKKPKTKHPS